MRVRGAGIVWINDGVALMHRKNVKREGKLLEYYTIPGGGIEEGETPEEGTIREIKEELGIDVELINIAYEKEMIDRGQKEYFYECKYLGGTFGTGDGPEFSNSPEYTDKGEYIPIIAAKKDLESMNILPKEIKEYLIKKERNV